MKVLEIQFIFLIVKLLKVHQVILNHMDLIGFFVAMLYFLSKCVEPNHPVTNKKSMSRAYSDLWKLAINDEFNSLKEN